MRTPPPSASDITPSVAMQQDQAYLRGRYELLHMLGKGGMGRVYLVRPLLTRQGSFPKYTVIKLMRIDAPSQTHQRERFREEVRIQESIDIPLVPKIYFAELDVDRPFCEMEYVGGCTFDALRDPSTKAVPLELLIPAALQFLQALDYADQYLGIVHRDLSPDNLMLTFEGRPKLIDFGLAKRPSSDQLTEASRFAGKVQFTSPENARSREYSHQSDIYSFGLCLLNLLSGRAWFEMNGLDRVEVAEILISRPVPKLSKLTTLDYPPDIERILSRATEKAPQDRYPRALDMAYDLEKAAENLDLLDADEAALFVRQADPKQYEMTQALMKPRRGLLNFVLSGWRR